MLFRSVAWDANYRSVWSPRQVRAGDFATLVTYGEMVSLAEEPSEYFHEEYERGIEVFDLRALSPLRLDAIRASVERTGRLVVVHEASRTAGIGAELAQRITERCFYSLEAPVLRVTGFDVPYPPSAFEEHFLPDLDRVLDGVDRVMAF